MIPLLTADEMRALEQAAIAAGRTTGLDLQEAAARGAAALIPEGVPVEVLAGPGNNGGDALAVARLLAERGQAVRVWTLSQDPGWKGDAAIQAERWRARGGALAFSANPWAVRQEFNAALTRAWFVDGLFGIGASRPLTGLGADWAAALQGHPSVLALDLPSGLIAGSGAVPGPVIRAARTACFGAYKRCHFALPAREACGELHLVPLPGLKAPQGRLMALAGLPFLPRHAWYAHKGTKGHVAIRAGRLGMSGAAVMAAWGALRAGAGLVTVLPDPEVRAEVAAQLPEAMVRPWEGEVPEGVDVLLAGCGGVDEVPDWTGPLVLDASALKDGEGPRWMARPETVITPHPGEFARLFGLPVPPASDPDARLAQFSEHAQGPGVCVLKGAQTLVGGGDLEVPWMNTTGHWGLATGGTGDFLAGLVAGLYAQAAGAGEEGPSPREAAAAAVWLHGACADRLGKGPLLPRDLERELPLLLRELYRHG